MFGWSERGGDRADLAVETIIPQRYREAHGAASSSSLTTGRGPILERRIEIEALHEDGHEFPVEMTITPVRVDGEYVFNAFLHDISERKAGRGEHAPARQHRRVLQRRDRSP